VRFARARSSLLVIALAAAAPREASAGGFEVADHGAQAMGRGTAFVARADDPTAIHWNPAGLARLRGTRLFLGGNVFLHSYEFHRAGSFPDDSNDPATPWGGRPFPTVQNSGGAFVSPFLALSTDFGTFDRLTFALGVYGPSAIGNRTFPLGISGAPAPSRYDFVQSRSSIIFPTLAAGYRLTKWLDVGVSGHLAIGNFDQTNITYADLGECKNAEYQPCDSKSTLTASATSAAATFGAMLRPSESIAFGLSLRTPVGFTAPGTVTPEPPRIADIQLEPGAATLYTTLPLVGRVGARYVSLDKDFEVYDLELDLVYEQWGSAQREGPVVDIPTLGSFSNIRTTVVHRYKDTFSIRGGGAYNIDAFDGVIALRAGGWFDTPATDFQYTRLDFDTLAKVAGTLGVGYRTGAFGLDFAYAAIASIPRVVGDGVGDVRPSNGAKGGQPLDANDDLLPAVNEGAYRGFTHVISLAATVTIDSFFGPMRPVRYGNSYEPGVVTEGEPKKAKPDDSKDKDRDKDRARERDEDNRPEKPESKPEPKPEPKPETKPKPKPEPEPDEEDDDDMPPPPAKKPPPKKAEPDRAPEPPVVPVKPPKKEEKAPPKKKEWWDETD
jgi:long-subunit fatty acid transport protein